MVNHRKTAIVSIAKYYLINLLFLICDELILPLQSVNRKSISKQRKVENKLKIEGKKKRKENQTKMSLVPWLYSQSGACIYFSINSQAY